MSCDGASMDARQWSARRDPAVWVVCAGYLALAIAYSFFMELGYAPDEVTRHLPYVEWLTNERTLPPADPNVDCGALELHPPLYYLLLTPVNAAADGFGRRAALRALRWTSPFLVLAAMFLWFAVIREACGADRQTTLFAFALTAWWPNLFVDAGALNNDVGAILACAAIAYVACVKQRASRSLGSAALLGALVGIGALMKSSVLTMGAPMVAVAIAWQHGKRFYADGRFWTRAVASGATCVAVCGWWYWRNLQLHGALIPVPSGYSLMPAHLTKLEVFLSGVFAPHLLRAVNGLWLSVFAGVVWFPEETHVVVYNVLRVLTALGLAGACVCLVRVANRQVRPSGKQAQSIVIPAIGFAVMLLSCIWVSMFVHAGIYQGGRYLMPCLPGLTIPFALGLKHVFPAQARPALMVVVVLFFLALNFLAWYHLATYWNPYVLSTGGRFE